MAATAPISKPNAPGRRPATSSSDDGDDGVLPSDMVREVMLRLPARPVCRFRAVCRSWRSLVSDPDFLAAHGARYNKPLVAVAVVGDKKPRKVEFVMLDLSGNIVRRVPGGWWNDQAKLHTQHHLAGITLESKCLRVRVVNLESGSVSVMPTSLDVEHGSSRRMKATCVALVLGRSASGKHKALRILDSGDERHWQHQFSDILTVSGRGRNAGWREAGIPPVPVFPSHGNAAVVNGIAYFLVYPPSCLFPSHACDFDGQDAIALFDLDAAKWSWSPMLLQGPLSSSCTDEDDYMFDHHGELRLRLAALNGHLVVVHFNDDCNTLDLWFHSGSFPEDGRTLWCRRYAIKCGSMRQMSPLWELEDGRLAMWDQNGLLRLYDPTTGDFVDVVKMENTCVSVGVYTGDMFSNY